MEHTEDLIPTSPRLDDSSDDVVIERPPVVFNIKPEVAALGVNAFDDLPLNAKVLEAVAKIGWTTPTPVQKLCLPFSLRGRDVAGFAQTGTGKTAVFLLTIVNKLLAARAEGEVGKNNRAPGAFVLAPTRELAMQIEGDAQEMFQHTGITSMAVFGGIDYDKQAQQLKDGVDVIVATPGRLKDYVQKKLVDLSQVQVFVCDECDRMFDMGFIEDVEFFLAKIPETAQRLLFSATTNENVKELAFEYLETPEYISVNPDVITPERIEQHGVHCHATDKLKVLMGLIQEHNPVCAIIFTNTKLTAEWLHYKMTNNGIEADLITGDLPQNKRIRLIQTIKEGKLKLLIATDVASRGLHISRVTHVYNFDLPDDPSNYIHRIGRTARAGAKGYAFSLVCDDYGQNLAAINDLLGDARVNTEWPNEAYLSFVDKSGNPFEDRYKKPPREFTSAPREDRGPREGGGSRDGGGRGPGGGRPQGDRPGAESGRFEGNGGGRGQQGGGRGGQGQGGGRGQQGSGRGGQGGGRGPGGGQRPQGDQQQGQGGGRGGQQGGGRNQGQGGRGQQGQNQGRNNNNNRDRPMAAAANSNHKSHGAEALDTPKTFGGTIKKLFKTIFGVK